MNHFIFDGSRPFDPGYMRTDVNGKTYVYVTDMHASVTAYTPFAITAGATGYISAAVYDTGNTESITSYFAGSGSGTWAFIGVLQEGITSGVGVWAQIGGYVPLYRVSEEGTVTAGSSLVWITASTYTGDTQFQGGGKVNEIGMFAATAEASQVSVYLLPKLSHGLS